MNVMYRSERKIPRKFYKRNPFPFGSGSQIWNGEEAEKGKKNTKADDLGEHMADRLHHHHATHHPSLRGLEAEPEGEGEERPESSRARSAETAAWVVDRCTIQIGSQMEFAIQSKGGKLRRSKAKGVISCIWAALAEVHPQLTFRLSIPPHRSEWHNERINILRTPCMLVHPSPYILQVFEKFPKQN